jgi:hypothetical protein
VGRYTEAEREAFARTVIEDGYCVVPGHFPVAAIDAWHENFAPLLAEQSERARLWLRFNPVVENAKDPQTTEVYQAFAY